VADQFTAGQLLVPVKPDARGAATQVRREFETMKNPVVKIDADMKAVEKEIASTQAKLDQLAARKADPKIDLDISAMTAKLAQANARLDELRGKTSTPKVDADILAAEAKVARITHDLDVLNKTKADPKIDLDMANADAKLAGLRARLNSLRDERVQVAMDVDTGGATAALTGFRAMASRLVGTVHSKVDVDTAGAIVQLAALSRALSLLAMPAAILGATPFLASLGHSAVQAAGGVGLMPAALSAAAISVGALKTATAGVGEALGFAFDPTKAKQFQEALAKLSPQARDTVLAIQGLGPQLTNVRTTAQDALFNGLGPLTTALGSQYLPLAADTFGRIAGSVNAGAHAFGGWLQSAQGIAQVTTIANGSALAFDNVFRAANPIAQAFVNIAAIGMPILVELTGGIGGVAERFRAWTASAEGINTITGWIRQSIVVIQQLWDLAVNVGSILGSIFDAGARSGESFLGVLVRITGDLAAALRTPEGAQGLTDFFTIVRGLAQGFAEKLAILWPGIMSLARGLYDVWQAGSPLLEVLFQLVSWALVPLGNVLSFISPILGPMVAAIVAIRIATAVWAGVQWLLNAALTANPIGLVIVAVAALVAGVIWAYQNFGWFRDIVDAAWRGIVAVAQWAWYNILLPVFQALAGWVVNTLGPALLWLWHNVMEPAWNGIVAVVSWAWTNVIQPYWNAMVWLVQNVIGPAVLWLWNNVFVPAWNAIGAVVSWAWTNIIQPYWNALVWLAQNVIGPAILWLWNNVFVPAFQAIAAVVQWAWVNIIQPVWNAMAWLVQNVIGPAVMWLWNTVMVPAWNAMGQAISFVWNTIIMPTWNNLVGFINNWIIPAVMWLWNNVFVPAWNGIGQAVSFAWNTLILPVWNALVGFVNNILIPAVMWLWNNVFVPAWNGIGTVISTVWNTIILPIWNALVGFVNNTMIPALNWLWHNVFEAAWNGIGLVIQTVWNTIILPIWNALVGFVNNTINPAIMWLWHNVFEAAWNGIGQVISYVWNNIILVAWNALVGFMQNTLGPVTQWLIDSVVRPVWDGIGAIIQGVWDNVIRPAWDAVAGGLRWLGDQFQVAVDRIGQVWNGLRRMLAAPVNFLINTVWNNGIVRAWNEVARLVNLPPVNPMAGIPEYARGGQVDATGGGTLRGPGGPREDKMLARVSPGEYVVRADVARPHRHFLDALNSGQAEARQAAGGRYANPPGYAVGGAVDKAKEFARSMVGKPYVWGGAGPGGSDCSGFMSQITNVLRGQAPHSRLGSTASMPWSGFAPGLTTSFSIGNTKNAGGGVGHMAGTLGGENVESRGGVGPQIGGGARGATDGLFPDKFSLGEAGGAFVGGAGGGGAAAPVVDTITPAIHAAYAKHADPVVRRFNQDNEIGSSGRINPNRKLPPGYGQLDRDSTIKRLLDEAQKVLAAQRAAAGAAGGAATGPASAGQLGHAKEIAVAAKERGIPREGFVIALMTGMQESGIRILANNSVPESLKFPHEGIGGDHDSVGIFQQRQAGWGTLAQRMNARGSAGLFFNKLGKGPYGDYGAAAQRVQVSAFPGAYTKHRQAAESLATQAGFDLGGVARGRGVMFKDVIADERVLNPRETAQYDTLTRLVREMQAGRLPGGAVDSRAAMAAARAVVSSTLTGMTIEGSVEVNGLEGRMRGVVVDTLENVGRAHSRGIRSAH